MPFHFLLIKHEYDVSITTQETYQYQLKKTNLKNHECSIFHLWKDNWFLLNREINYQQHFTLQKGLLSLIKSNPTESLFVYYYLRGPPEKVELSQKYLYKKAIKTI